jgi:hypothetical protein
VPSTGVGDAVEWSTALSEALASLSGEETNNSGAVTDAEHCSRIATNLALRVSVLQEQLRPLISRSILPSRVGVIQLEGESVALVNREKELQERTAEVRMRESQVEELKASRDAAVASERRVRRNVYRLAANMINIDQVMAAIQDDTEVVDADLRQEIVKLKLLKQEQELDATTGSASRSNDEEGQSAMDREPSKSATHVASARFDAMQTRICDLERALANRDQSIEQV